MDNWRKDQSSNNFCFPCNILYDIQGYHVLKMMGKLKYMYINFFLSIFKIKPLFQHTKLQSECKNSTCIEIKKRVADKA